MKRNTAIMALIGLVLAAASASLVVAAKAPRSKKTIAKTKAPRDNKTAEKQNMNEASGSAGDQETAGLQKATFGNGCFWCSEAVFQQIKGVRSVVSGYSGGVIENPTYQEVCGGRTGHAEVIQITFDPKTISYRELLEVFWQSHDPTTLNRQGADVGTQYRSVIFHHNQQQKDLAEHYKKELTAERAFPEPIVTEITELSEFYPAEGYHQNYYNGHKQEGYCMAVIRPKVSKVQKVFREKLKEQGRAGE